MAAEERRKSAEGLITLSVCGAAGCQALESDALRTALASAAAAQGLGPDRCRVRQVGCLGLCGAGPIVSVEPGGYAVSASAGFRRARYRLGARDGGQVERIRLDPQLPFFQRQRRIVLENSGRIDPDRLEDYIAEDGYLALGNGAQRNDAGGRHCGSDQKRTARSRGRRLSDWA